MLRSSLSSVGVGLGPGEGDRDGSEDGALVSVPRGLFPSPVVGGSVEVGRFPSPLPLQVPPTDGARDGAGVGAADGLNVGSSVVGPGDG